MHEFGYSMWMSTSCFAFAAIILNSEFKKEDEELNFLAAYVFRQNMMM